MTLTGATVAVTNDGSAAVSNGAIYKNERNIDLSFELDSQEVDSQSLTFGQKDTYFATVTRSVSFSFTTVLGRLAVSGVDIADGVADLLQLSNMAFAETTAIGGFRAFNFTPNSTASGTGEVTITTVDRTVVIGQVTSDVSISVSKGGETELTFNVEGVVTSDTQGQTNTLADPAKPLASVLTTTDGINTGVTVNSVIADPISVGFNMNMERHTVKGLTEIETIVDNIDPKITLDAYLSAQFVEGYDAIVAGTEVPIVVNYEDTGDNILWQLSVPRAKVVNLPNRADTEGVYSLSKEYRCRPLNGNDGFTLTYISELV